MFYRLLKISAWARRRQKLAILVITLLQIVFIILSLAIGKILYQAGYVLGRPFIILGFLLIIDGIFLFPYKDEVKQILVNPRKFWMKMIATMFISIGASILLISYAGNKEFKTDERQGFITRAYAIETAPRLSTTQSSLQHDYTTKFIVKLGPEHSLKTLNFWRVLALIFMGILLLAIVAYTGLLYCASLCAGNIIMFALLTVDSIFFIWGAAYWLFNGAFTKENRYNFGMVLSILLYALTLASYMIFQIDFDIPDAIWPVAINLIFSLLVFIWGHNWPLFRFRRKKIETKTE